MPTKRNKSKANSKTKKCKMTKQQLVYSEDLLNKLEGKINDNNNNK